jgi:LPS-assembly lipoprotein
MKSDMRNLQSSRRSFYGTFSAQRCLRAMACIALCAMVAACGFRLKGVSPLPFETLYTNIAENSAFGAQIRRAIVASSPNTRFVSEPADAQARLIQISSEQSLREVSIDAQGLVEEYELTLVFVFQLTDAAGHVILPPTTLVTTREIPYDATVVQAKQGEIGALFLEMQQSQVDRIVRRIASPDVAEAFEKAAQQPTEANPASDVPAAPATQGGAPTPWSSQLYAPGGGIR